MLIIAVAGACLFFTTVGLIFQMFSYIYHAPGYTVHSAFIALSNGCVYIADCAITFFRCG
jgi:hypothetical protein